ncbi:hypothetical protein LTR53_016929 [Teratosphaeriaceae sp. CCFEE 6253]|nr:hypothetical protein LTR53_016929 [Teratosphaeriaceae sp. CCFEE 6253]
MSTSSDSRAAKKILRKEVSSRLPNLSESHLAAQSLAAQEIILSLPQYHDAKRIGIYLSMPVREARTDLLVTRALAEGKAVFVPYIHTSSPSLATPAASPTTDTNAIPAVEGECRQVGGAAKAGGKVKAKAKEMAMLRLASLAEYRSLPRDGWGIPSLHPGGVEGRENAVGGVGLSPLAAPASPSLASDTNADLAPEAQVGVPAHAGLDLIVVPGVAFDEGFGRLGHGAGFYDRYLTRHYGGDGGRRTPFLVGMCLAEQVVPLGRIQMEAWDWSVDAVAVGDGRLLRDGEGP